ncbi:hypothetical protein [Ereboglobus luteus]|uniref:hypothetical protein n=1 Tax=Ereboglobus luteus TaxID=1796921 RepID=UPI00126038E0|nr:hypothetical protein [Ereboglobus luteus]
MNISPLRILFVCCLATCGIILNRAYAEKANAGISASTVSWSRIKLVPRSPDEKSPQITPEQQAAIEKIEKIYGKPVTHSDKKNSGNRPAL